MTRDLVMNEYNDKKMNLHNQWLVESEYAWSTRKGRVAYPAMPAHPTEGDIITRAEKFLNFIALSDKEDTMTVPEVEETPTELPAEVEAEPTVDTETTTADTTVEVHTTEMTCTTSTTSTQMTLDIQHKFYNAKEPRHVKFYTDLLPFVLDEISKPKEVA